VPRRQVVEKPTGSAARAAADAAGEAATAGDRAFIFALLAAGTAIILGLIWDISWDMSFGRDSFWSPPHLTINAGGALGAAAALFWAFRATRGRDPAAVRFGLLRMPLGAALVLWGSIGMLASGALEIAWAQAYGMSVGGWTPPQVVYTIAVGALLAGILLVAASRGAQAPRFAEPWAGGMLVAFAALVLLPYSVPNLQHTALFFLVSSAVFPLLLAWIARAGQARLAATRAAAVYMAMVCIMVWVLPFFPAQALIGPVFEKVHHMVPPRFPLLLVVQGFAFDRVLARKSRADEGAWGHAAALGVLFTATFVLVQWVFAGFLLSSASDNAFFAGGGRHWPFYMDIGEERRQFWDANGRLTALTAGACVVIATLAARVGLLLGRFTRAVKR
jgi:hypothetical protein